MRPVFLTKVSSCFLFAGLCLPLAGRAANLTTTNIQASGANWTAAIWKTNAPGFATNTAAGVAPVPGNTYEAVYNGISTIGNGLSNTRIRPPTSGNATFPGDSLTMRTNTELRFKAGSIGNIMNFPGVGGNPGLILNGGVLNGGDDATFPIRGYIQVVSSSFISHGANGGGGAISQNRALDFQGILGGSGSIEIINAGTTVPQIVSGNSNTFSGQWIVQCGWLQGNGTNSLGTNNNILVDPLDTAYLNLMPNATSPQGPAWFEVGYNINSAGTLTLQNGGQMRLHQNCTFTAVTIEGVSLPAGTHLYSELISTYNPNNNFAPGGVGSITVQPYGTPPIVIPQFVTQPRPETLYAGQTATFSASVLGDQVSYQWLKNGSAMSDGGNVSGSLTPTLTISGVSGADVANYSLRASNPGGTATSSVVGFSIVQPTGSPDIAVVTNGAMFYYPLDEQGDPFTNTYCFDVLSGKTGIYGVASQNGFNNVAGPRPTDGFPGFPTTNTAAQSATSVGNSWITLPAFNLNTNLLTISAWINPSGGQLANEGIVMCRSGSTVAGLILGTNAFTPTLGYIWNNNASTYNFNSGITVPSGQWSFVGVVITPTNGTLYLINTNSFQTAVNTFTNPPQAFAGNTLIGDDINDNTTFTRVFNGAIDSVAIFTNSLNINQMISLYSAASGVSTFPVNIVNPPQSTSVYSGQTASFTVQASGPSLTYQWQAALTGSGGPYTNIVNGGKFSGATTATLTIVNATSVNGLDYVVVVSNASGSVTNTYFSPATLTIQPVGPAQAITMACQQAAGNDWDIGNCWSDGNAASASAASNPGSTYEVLAGARLRTPAGVSYAAFPTTNLAFGYVPQLKVDGNGVFIDNPGTGTPQAEIRFKANLATGTNYFGKLIMNGGQLDNGGSPAGLWVIQGEMDILANTAIYVDSAGSIGRPYRIESWLTGNGSIEYHDFDNSLSASLNITGNTNTYSGTWNVVVGPLLGSGNNSLGTNSITVGPNGDLETMYNLNSPNATLTLNGQMFLHQNDTIGAMYVDSVPVPAATYTYAQLAAAYPSHFPATWTAITGSTSNRASGSIIVRTTAPPLPIRFTAGLGAPIIADAPPSVPVTYSAAIRGGTPPFSYQWYANGAAVPGATNGSFNFIPGSTVTNTIYVVAGNGAGTATNGPATLVVMPVGPVITFADPANWSVQGAGTVPAFTPDTGNSNMLTLTTDVANEAASAFYNVGQYIGAFNASFVYIPSGSLLADGVTFCLQNSAAGASALGGNGGNLGYVGINNSAVLAMNIYAPNIIGIAFASGGQTVPATQPTDPVNIATGNPITVQISWLGDVLTTNGVVPSPLQVTLTDTTAGTQFTTNYPVGDLASFLRSSIAYVGFTGATGGSSAQQQIDVFSFQYLSAPVLAVNASAGNVRITWPAGVASTYHLQQSDSINGPWSNVSTTPTVVNGYNQVVLAASGAAQFYRLISP